MTEMNDPTNTYKDKLPPYRRDSLLSYSDSRRPTHTDRTVTNYDTQDEIGANQSHHGKKKVRP